MGIVTARLTVFFEDPFWVGVYERQDGPRYEVSKITFGAEPKDYDVYRYLLDHWKELRFSPALPAQMLRETRQNPKRLQRTIRAELRDRGVGTKAQQALKLQQEEGAQARKRRTRLQKEEERERRLQLRQEQKREKHRGH